MYCLVSRLASEDVVYEPLYKIVSSSRPGELSTLWRSYATYARQLTQFAAIVAGRSPDEKEVDGCHQKFSLT
jgi:hypothetical protein